MIRWIVGTVRGWFAPWEPEGRYVEVYHAYRNPYDGSGSESVRDLTHGQALEQVRTWIAAGFTDAAVIGPSIKYVKRTLTS